MILIFHSITPILSRIEVNTTLQHDCHVILYQVATATASPKYVKPPLFSKKVAVFEYMLYY